MPKTQKKLLVNKNDDFKGTIKYVDNNEEIVDYHEHSSVRIWYNVLNEGFKPHWHDALEIVMPLEKTYSVVIDGEMTTVRPGEFFIIPSGVMHELVCTESGGARFIYLFDLTPLKSMKSFGGLEAAVSQPMLINKERYPRIYDDTYNLLVKMRNVYFYDNTYGELSIYGSLCDFFVLLGENHDTDEQLFNNIKPSKQQQYVKEFNKLLEYINENYMQQITLEDAAENIGFSKYYFSRLFKQYTQYTFCDYLTSRRIRAAKEMLSNLEYSILDIAMSTGFASISTFNRVFKEAEKCTPSAFRAKIY